MSFDRFCFNVNHIKNNSIDGFEYFNSKTILITGATGLLGTNLVAFLKSTEYKFKCVLVFYNAPEKFFLDIINNDERFECVQCDLTNIQFFDCYFGNDFDIIFHFATYGQPSKVFTDSPNPNQLKTIKLNTNVLIGLFGLLKHDGKFVFLSTSELYNGLDRIVDESDIGTTTPDDFRGCYIESKRCGEAICNYYKNVGFDVSVIRLCLAYGTGVKIDDRRALNNFIYNALTNKKIELLDKGEAIRTYCYVADVINMILNIALHGNFVTYNVGGIETMSIREIAEIVGYVLNVPVILPCKEKEVTGASKCAILNINKYTKEFGERKFVDMKTGIIETIKWCEYLLKGENGL
jgi:nucleoside-diphosphate-sugar epimerase